MIDPWGNEVKENTLLEFGVSTDFPPEGPWPIKEGIVFAHREYDAFVKDWKDGKPVALLTGIKPSGRFHLGSAYTALELIAFQQYFDAPVYYVIADLEGRVDNKRPFSELDKLAVDNIADVLALGLDVERSVIYKQSQNPWVMRQAYVYASLITNATLKAIYGDRPVGLYMAALTQIGDILYPQKSGPRRVLVPVGVDQDPHLRLTRDVAERLRLVKPASVYHKILPGLTGGKMSKRDPMSVIYLDEGDEDLRRKIYNAFTGGQPTIKEQREKGGHPERCALLKLGSFFIRGFAQRAVACRRGEIVCGECKEER